MVMLRFLALVTGSHTFDDTSLNAHGLFGQALVTNLVYEALHHVKPTRCIDQAQRDETFVNDTDRLSKTDLSCRDLSLLGRLEHEGTNHQMGQQKRIDFLDDPFRSQTAQG